MPNQGANPENERNAGKGSKGSKGAASHPYRKKKGGRAPFSNYALKIERLRVESDRVVCYLTLPNKRWRYTTPAVAKRAMHDYPNLPQHLCVNAKGDTFGSVIRRTPLPHLLEHLSIDILAGKSRNPEDVFAGFSTWVGNDRDKARVEITMRDDVSTLKAVKQAATYINKIVYELDQERITGKKPSEGERKQGAGRGSRGKAQGGRGRSGRRDDQRSARGESSHGGRAGHGGHGASPHAQRSGGRGSARGSRGGRR